VDCGMRNQLSWSWLITVVLFADLQGCVADKQDIALPNRKSSWWSMRPGISGSKGLRGNTVTTVSVSLCRGFQTNDNFEEVVASPRHQPERRVSIELRHAPKLQAMAVPVIYMTGNDNPAVARCAGICCIAYLKKPSRRSASRAGRESTAGLHRPRRHEFSSCVTR